MKTWLEEVAMWFYVASALTTISLVAMLAFDRLIESADRQVRLESDIQIHSLPPPGRSLNSRDPAARKELREKGIILPDEE
jgi:hypothetical protein